MKMISRILTAFVALEHLFILWIEMFAWETVGSRVFTVFSGDFFTLTKSMAANQGLYNGFLAAGLIWALLIKDRAWSFRVARFFLGCVLVAAVFGAFTVETKILITQGVPAFLGLAALLVSGKKE
ncbi:MAG: DUF1304 domain-containing protein [Spirochaetales bacterium]|nr:DUF1304 domain-containing protein [Spirochaetales bacterium]